MILPSCGWHLRGSVNLPPVMGKTFVKGTAKYSQLGNLIRNVFTGQEARLVDDISQATAVLHILTNNFSKRVLSTDSAGRATEYELTYALVFKVTDKDDKPLISEQQALEVRDFRFNPDNVLSNDAEEKQLRKDMLQAGVQTMFRRISAGLRYKINTQAD